MYHSILTDNTTIGKFGSNKELICTCMALSSCSFPIYCYLWKKWIFINIQMPSCLHGTQDFT